jgi:hypothetical protein
MTFAFWTWTTERAVVLCLDEKSQIQALDRPQPLLPLMPGAPERRSYLSRTKEGYSIRNVFVEHVSRLPRFVVAGTTLLELNDPTVGEFGEDSPAT